MRRNNNDDDDEEDDDDPFVLNIKRKRYDSVVIGYKYTFIGTIFLKHETRRNWFSQFSVYIRPGHMVLCYHQGKGKGPQSSIEKSLGSEVRGEALVSSTVAAYSLMPGCTNEEGIASAKENFNDMFGNAVWLWAN